MGLDMMPHHSKGAQMEREQGYGSILDTWCESCQMAHETSSACQYTLLIAQIEAMLEGGMR